MCLALAPQVPGSEEGTILDMPSFLPGQPAAALGPDPGFSAPGAEGSRLRGASCLPGGSPTAGSRGSVWDPTASFPAAESGHFSLPVHLGIRRAGRARPGPPRGARGREGAGLRTSLWLPLCSLLSQPGWSSPPHSDPPPPPPPSSPPPPPSSSAAPQVSAAPAVPCSGEGRGLQAAP